ncbi:SGNH/GDSL hydrolase family protein [Planctomonas sp. JC2975]|uniref:GDSL-type esterase/lipase family protein n=1 Tax=Planctomonas sp. JC2975 TaxID=2729626 RepID=UPI001475504E|nr:SGNH/GDSL hydrolase family protein [Planctomonas sp. JC2975]
MTVGIAAITAAEALWTRGQLATMRPSIPSARNGLFGDAHQSPPLQLAVMGDSLAVGYGAEDESHTVGVILANGLAAASERSVQLTNVAEVGAVSSDLPAQLVRLRLVSSPDVAVIIVGTNDAFHLVPLPDSLSPLRATITELRSTGARVVLASCPDLGTVRRFVEPMRFVAHWASRFLATGQTIVALRAGARTVSLADALGPLFRRDPGSMFSQLDRLHPSDLGYSNAAAALLPSVLAAAGYRAAAGGPVPHRVYENRSRRPLAWIAFRASRRAGVRVRKRRRPE